MLAAKAAKCPLLIRISNGIMLRRLLGTNVRCQTIDDKGVPNIDPTSHFSRADNETTGPT
eukprot:341691-Amphidinium_carterae.1